MSFFVFPKSTMHKLYERETAYISLHINIINVQNLTFHVHIKYTICINKLYLQNVQCIMTFK